MHRMGLIKPAIAAASLVRIEVGELDKDPSGGVRLDWDAMTFAAGDLVIVFACNDGGNPQTITGFTDILVDIDNNPETNCRYRFVDGNETGTDTVFAATQPDSSGGYVVYRNASTPTFATAISVANGDPDPPSLGSIAATSHVIAAGFLDDDYTAGTATPPSGYTHLATWTSNNTAADTGSSTSIAVNESPSATENPGVIDFGTTDRWNAATIQIPLAV